VMDKRIFTKPYGKVFLESLPPFTLTSKIEELSEFFDSLSKKGN